MNLILAHRRCDLAAVALAVALGVAAAGDARAMGAGGGGSGGPPRAATDGAAPMSERDAGTGPATCEKGMAWDVASRKCAGARRDQGSALDHALVPSRLPCGIDRGRDGRVYMRAGVEGRCSPQIRSLRRRDRGIAAERAPAPVGIGVLGLSPSRSRCKLGINQLTIAKDGVKGLARC